MEYPDEAIEGISKRIIPLPQHGVEPFVNDHLATVNYRLPSGDKSEETKPAAGLQGNEDDQNDRRGRSDGSKNL